MKSLHISNLPSDTTEEAITEAFKPYGPMERIALLDQKNGEAGKKRDYAFVHYEKRSNMLKAFEVRLVWFMFPCFWLGV